MDGMFHLTAAFNQPLATWDVRNVRCATAFNQPLDAWDVSQAANMEALRKGATSFNQPLSTWNLSPTFVP
jgi:hypothetical protein